MGLPTVEDNLLGYNNTDLTRSVEGLRGKYYFVIHGSGDDNVHYQQTLLLVKALETADIGFTQQVSIQGVPNKRDYSSLALADGRTVTIPTFRGGFKS